ncbi:MAG: Flp pilus assembly complex ATPase component TadA [Lactobacillales bacterium]|jgi:type IV secretion system protein VirB11|nr:Flp pilus assembly complex ATPase component TadA [Lactobacillales bacterium]
MADESNIDKFRVLESVLRPLSYWYNQDGIEEIAINNPGGIWLRRRGKYAHPWIYNEDEKLTREYLKNVLYIIANSYDKNFNPEGGTPVVYVDLPGGHRFTGITGQNVQYDSSDELAGGGIAITIRVFKENLTVGFKDFNFEKGARLRPLNKLSGVEDPDDPYERLLLSIKRGDHLLISGATSTGKTTFLNNIIKMLDRNKRILTIEDTRELIVPHKNRVHIVISRTKATNDFTYQNVIDLAVRFTPDAIIGGEVSTSNANALWELMGTGHENCFATIHAESPEAAYKAFIGRIMYSTPTIDREKTLREMKEKLRVVQINRNGNIRAVTAVT